MGLAACSIIILNYHYTFRSRKSHGEAFSRFAMVSVTGLVLNSFTMAIGTRLFRLHYLLAQIASTVIVLLWNFYANLLWSFREKSVGGERLP